MRVVLDSNVIIAAFATRGLCQLLFQMCLEQHDLFLSEGLLEEIGRFFRERAKLPGKEVRGILSFLQSQGGLVHPESIEADVCRDPDDVEVLGVAVSAKADVIVTGDRDLLVLGKFRSIPIISPRDFLTLRGERKE